MKPSLASSATTFSSFAVTLLFVLLLAAASPAPAQKAQKKQAGKSVNFEQLRSTFVAAVGNDFQLVKDELRPRSNESGGGTYWLAHLKTKHPGTFTLSYRYNYNDPLYSHVERTFNLNIGRKSCRRGVPSYGSYFRFCLGDTIILPVVINNFTEHEFTLKSTAYTPEQDEVWEKVYKEPADDRLDQTAVNNPAADLLRYVGSNSYKLLHRNGGYTLEAQAVFEAQNPGRLNLSLGPAFADLPSAVLSSVGTGGGTSIIIVSRDTPLTLLASGHDVNGYTMGYDGREYFSSTSGDAFMVDVMFLQPGDRIALKYYTTIRSARYERSELAKNATNDGPADSHSRKDEPDIVPPPVISKLPFALKTDYNFTEWLADYLPR